MQFSQFSKLGKLLITMLAFLLAIHYQRRQLFQGDQLINKLTFTHIAQYKTCMTVIIHQIPLKKNLLLLIQHFEDHSLQKSLQLSHWAAEVNGRTVYKL